MDAPASWLGEPPPHTLPHRRRRRLYDPHFRCSPVGDTYCFRPGNGTNVVLFVVVFLPVVIRFPLPKDLWFFQPIVMKLFTHITNNILHPATVVCKSLESLANFFQFFD